MMKRLRTSWGRSVAGIVMALVLLHTASQGQLPSGIMLPADEPRLERKHPHPEPFPQNPNLQPAFRIPVGPLGFSVPGPHYLYRHEVLASLDFLDEDRLLFSFRVPGLLERAAGDKTVGKKRQIRALVLTLPTGKITSEGLWVVPDQARYLWILKNGYFLLRDQDGVEQGDDTLRLAPFRRFPGEVLWLEMDPAQQLLITNSLEAPQAPGDAPAPASTTASGQESGGQPVLVARTMRRESGEVIRTSRVPWTSQTSDWPMNSEGYLESSNPRDAEWLLTLKSLDGGSRTLGSVESTCLPTLAFVSDRQLLATTCDPEGGWKLVALSSGGDRLWEVKPAANANSALTVMAPNGSRLARETLLLKRPLDNYKKHPVGPGDVEGQVVTVYDAANGKMVLETPASPVLDGGGNVAISPSGRRVAVLNGGAIQVFELPPPASSAAAEDGRSLP